MAAVTEQQAAHVADWLIAVTLAAANLYAEARWWTAASCRALAEGDFRAGAEAAVEGARCVVDAALVLERLGIGRGKYDLLEQVRRQTEGPGEGPGGKNEGRPERP